MRLSDFRRLFTTRGLLLLTALLVLTLNSAAQELYAGLEGHVKDASGAFIAQATIEVTSPALIGVKSMQSDAGGYFRFVNLPPGDYTLTVTARGFRSYKQSGITLTVGRLPAVEIALQVGTASETVEVTAAAPLIDVAQSKVAVTVPEQVIEGIPKGRSFQSLIQFAPGARYEPLQTCNGCPQGFQIDGASTSENSYLVEGQETSAIRSGQISTNIPMEFIQEVQVKTSGFEAEYGGALGGVVNIIQKRGSNAWHGSLVTYYQGDAFNAAPNRQVRYVPNTTTGSARLDQPWEFYQPKKDHYRIVEPGFELGGFLVKDRLWTFGSFVPRLERDSRTVTMNYNPGIPGVAPVLDKRNFNTADDTYYSLARVDFLASQKVRLYAAWQYAYQKQYGTELPQADSPYYVSGIKNQFNPDSTQNPDNYFTGMGWVRPNRVWNLGADITLTPTLVATSRFGFSLYDSQMRGRPTHGIRYQYRDTNYPYNLTTPLNSSVSDLFNCKVLNADGTCKTYGTFGDIPGFTAAASSLFAPAGFSNMAVNRVQDQDRFNRYSFTQDLAWFKKTGLGEHNLKVGYAFNRLEESPIVRFHDSYFVIGWGQPYNELPVNTANCAAIRAQNQAWFNAPGTEDDTSCIGRYGTINVGGTTTEMFTPASSFNHSLYFQDGWRVGHGVTLNLGIRFDKETLPPFDATRGPNFKGINFGFLDKMAPRLGGAWDVLGNGKIKAFASYGWFYDIMKYSLPRGSFGGEYWHDCVYTLDTLNISAITPIRDAAGTICPSSGPVNGIASFTGPGSTGVGRFIENQDYRAPSNDPNNYLIDRHLKPMRQQEFATGMDWAITPKLALEARYSRKRLDRTIEDAGLQTALGETFYIVNPGMGIHVQPLPSSECVGCPTQPKAMRRYDGVEFRLTRQASANWFGTVSYTFSRLYGNYSGLASTDQSDGRGIYAGRTDPNNNRSFDEPNMQFDSHGKVIDGPLATDRPHTLKGFGYYRLKWWKMETLLGATQQIYSGTPITSYVSAAYAPDFVEGRGKFVEITRDPTTGNWVKGRVYDRRTPMFSQTDLNLVHEMHVSKSNENMKVGFEVNVLNLFNQHSVVNVYANMIRTGTLLPNLGGVPANSVSGIDYHALLTGWNYIDAANGVNADNSKRILNSQYGQPELWQDGRAFRFKVKYIF